MRSCWTFWLGSLLAVLGSPAEMLAQAPTRPGQASASATGQQLPKPTRLLGPEKVDFPMIASLREEGLLRSHVLAYVEGLADLIGPRLTGSPEFTRGAQWCQQQLAAMGVANARLESWGPFGMAWTQLGTSVWLAQPAPATLLAQATPWSPATAGEVAGPAILVPQLRNEADLARWRGKLAGKVILYGAPPPINPNPVPPLVLLDEAQLAAYARYPLQQSHALQDNRDYYVAENFDERVAAFFSAEQALAVLRAGGEAEVLHDDNSLSMGSFVYLKDHRQPIPSAVISSDAYGRLTRLLARQVPVVLRVNIQTRFGADQVDGQNVLGDIMGTDPKLKNQVVMFGAHLDSWAAGTGATDNGAGVAIALEAMRILKSLGVRPRRTIRVALWGGEEQGELGSLGYVNAHLAQLTYSSAPDMTGVPQWLQTPISIVPHPDFRTFSVYFNADHGGGRFLGINAEGNLAAAELFRQWTGQVSDLDFSTVTLRHSGQTDSENFDLVGLPGFQFIQAPRDDSRTHHTNLDTFERLSEPDLKQAATVLAIFVYNAAQRDAPFPRKNPPKLTKPPATSSQPAPAR